MHVFYSITEFLVLVQSNSLKLIPLLKMWLLKFTRLSVKTRQNYIMHLKCKYELLY